ncbi:MAG: ABC transporter substrate-binding protein [Clostridiales Family XIII bacterium]|jgi:ABC-type nitrate/sulfonate/bicarbonate transport system substrate-binding protein|nr:ABC transporter substrate-binding protein [Clostridiales Family XIII bacterium]
MKSTIHNKTIHNKTIHNKTRLKRLLLIALAITLAFAFTACGGSKEPEESGGAAGTASEEKELFPLRMVTQTTNSETIIADRLGFFANEGIEAVFIGTLGQGVTQYQAIATGDLDVFTQGHLTNEAQARIAGLDIKTVQPGFVDDEEYPHVTYLVREDSDIQSIEDFAGKKVGITMNGVCIDGYITKYFTEHGLDPSTVEYVTLPQPGQAEQAVVQGLIDVTTSHSPFGGIALAAGGVRRCAASWDIFENPAAGMATRGFSGAFIEEHPDVVQGWANALYHARVFIEKYPEYAREVSADYLGLDAKDVSLNRWPQERNVPQDWAEFWFDLSEELGYWEAGDITIDEVLTNEFVPTDYPVKYDEIVNTSWEPKGKQE